MMRLPFFSRANKSSSQQPLSPSNLQPSSLKGQRPHQNAKPDESLNKILLDTVNECMEDHKAPTQSQSAKRKKIHSVLQNKLTPLGKASQSLNGRALPKNSLKTGFEGIFKLADSDTYLLTLPNNEVVERTLDEIKTHILLESYLHTEYGDARVDKNLIISARDIDTDVDSASGKDLIDLGSPITLPSHSQNVEGTGAIFDGCFPEPSSARSAHSMNRATAFSEESLDEDSDDENGTSGSSEEKKKAANSIDQHFATANKYLSDSATELKNLLKVMAGNED